MTTSEVRTQEMYEAESAAIWEGMVNPYDGEKMKQAERSMWWSIEELDKACDSVNEAAEILVDTPLGDRVSSILSDMENVLCDLKRMRETFAKGVS